MKQSGVTVGPGFRQHQVSPAAFSSPTAAAGAASPCSGAELPSSALQYPSRRPKPEQEAAERRAGPPSPPGTSPASAPLLPAASPRRRRDHGRGNVSAAASAPPSPAAPGGGSSRSSWALGSQPRDPALPAASLTHLYPGRGDGGARASSSRARLRLLLPWGAPRRGPLTRTLTAAAAAAPGVPRARSNHCATTMHCAPRGSRRVQAPPPRSRDSGQRQPQNAGLQSAEGCATVRVRGTLPAPHTRRGRRGTVLRSASAHNQRL